jgi:hypothetical protein
MNTIRKTSSLLATAVVVAILGLLLISPSATGAPASAAATHANRFTDVPVTGTTSTGQAFRGTMDITRFVPRGGGVAAVGKITGTVKNASGAVTKSVINAPATIPLVTGASAGADAAQNSCNILHLVLGPLDLNLLGLQVHLNRVVLDITAQQGSGQLLGNLLCALAHLLDGTGTPDVLSQLLTAVTRIVDLLGALG